VDLYKEGSDEKFDASEIPYADNSVDEIRAYHIIEHWTFTVALKKVIKEWNRVLKRGGLLHIETPDLYNTCKLFVDCDEQTRIRLYGHLFAFPDEPGNAHFFLYTEQQLRWTLETNGFTNVQRVEPDSSYVKGSPDLPKSIYLNMTAIKR
jgi:predicted SAM-dependent methyltransferase